jgi:hypothetical protein
MLFQRTDSARHHFFLIRAIADKILMERTPKQFPWWIAGFWFAFVCLFGVLQHFVLPGTADRGPNECSAILAGTIFLVATIWLFIKQHPQYGIKHIFFVTLYVAILGSIYASVGLAPVLITALATALGLTLYFSRKSRRDK